MDRFIVNGNSEDRAEILRLKSNMDRFIEKSKLPCARCSWV